MIAKSKAELLAFEEDVKKMGYKKTEKVADFFSSRNTYFIADNMAKDFYDFIVQYPTGQVEFFNKKTMQSETFTPDYKNSAIVFLVEKNNLNNLQSQGFDLLSKAGPAFRS